MASIRSLASFLIAGVFSLGASGCMIPVYHQPQGFSSTYYRQLQKSAPVMQGAYAPVEELAKSPEKPKPPADTEAPEVTGDETPAAEKSGSWWSWIRRPITLRSNSAADEDDEEDSEPETDEASRGSANRR